MKHFSIRELERYTGIKAHTIRTWEKRYGLLKPVRNDANIRSYSLTDTSLLLDISLLLSYGYKISRLASLSHQEISKKIHGLKYSDARLIHQINALVKAMFSNNADEFESVLDAAQHSFGIDVTVQKMIVPFLEKTSVLSYKDNSVAVHLAVTAVRKKIILAIEKLPAPVSFITTAVLFLPKGEHYDLLLLYTAYLLKSKSWKVIYLGTNISLENLHELTSEKKPECLITHMVSEKGFPLHSYLELMHQHLPSSRLYVLHTGQTIPNNLHDHTVRFLKHSSAEKIFETNF